MRAGPLRHRIDVMENIKAQDPITGEIITTWVVHKRLWARVEPLSVRDFMASQAPQSKIVARVVIRFRSDLEPAMQIWYRGKKYKIEGTLPDADSGLEYLTIPVSEVI